MRRLLLSCLVMLLPATALADQPIQVKGCVMQQIEFGCLVLRTGLGRMYNISAAMPPPAPNTYGRVEGTLRTGWVTVCPNRNIINPATWTTNGKFCPQRKAKK